MKDNKILLIVIFLLLGVVIFNQIKIESSINPSVTDTSVDTDTISDPDSNESEDDIKDSYLFSETSYQETTEYYHPTTHYHESEKPREKLVDCLACQGLGHNPYEIYGNTCTVCDGKRKMLESEMYKRYEQWAKQIIPCKQCNGTGLSYKARVTGYMNMDLLAPPGYYNCKVCRGKKEGTRAELIRNFQIANQVYGPAL